MSKNEQSSHLSQIKTRLDRLFVLLDCGTSSSTREAAARQLGEVVKVHTGEVADLVKRLHPYLESKSWDTRISAGKAVRAVAENLKTTDCPHGSSTTISDSGGTNSLLSTFNVLTVFASGLYLSGGSDTPMANNNDNDGGTNQRKLINKSLGLDVMENLGVSTKNIFSDEDLKMDTDIKNVFKKDSLRNVVMQEICKYQRIYSRENSHSSKREAEDACSSPEAKKIKLCEDSIFEAKNGGCWPLEDFSQKLCENMFHSSWEIRHGASTALRELISVLGPSISNGSLSSKYKASYLNQCWLEDKAVKTICVMGMDRFVDFVSDEAVAPIRETCAQLLGCITKYLSNSSVLHLKSLLVQMTSWNEWGTRHASYLGLKYLLLVRTDMRAEIFNEIYEILIIGLNDNIDDVVSVAAACLVTVSDHIVKESSSCNLNSLLKLLWDSFLECDDLTGSINAILELLSTLICNPKVSHSLQEQHNAAITRLWPFLYQPSTNIRRSVLKTLLSISQNAVDNSSSSMSSFLESVMKHMYQCILLEHVLENLELALKVWNNAVSLCSPDQIEKISWSSYSSWLFIIMHSPKSHVDPNFILIPSVTKKKNFEHEEEIKKDKKYYIGYTYVDLLEDGVVHEKSLQSKLFAAKALGSLAHNFFKVMISKQCDDSSLDSFKHLHLTYLSSKSAWSRLAIGYVLREWASNKDFPSVLFKKELLKALTETVYYEEVAWSFARLQRDIKDFISMLVVAKIKVENSLHKKNIFTMEDVLAICGENTKENINKLSKLKKKPCAVLEERRQELSTNHFEITQELCKYNLLVQSSLAGAVIASSDLPDKLTPVVKPIMDSLRLEQNSLLQKLSAVSLTNLIEMCINRDPSPNAKIILNLCNFLYSNDPLNSENLDTDPILVISKQNQEENIKDIVKNGSSSALINITVSFGSRLKISLNSLYDIIFSQLINSKIPLRTIEESKCVLQSFQVTEIITPYLHSSLLDELVTYADCLCGYLTESFSIVRHVAARTFAKLTEQRTNECLEFFIEKWLPVLDKPMNEVNKRAKKGCLEYIYFVIEILGLKIIPYILMLIGPLLRRVNDNDESIRNISTHCFGILLRLYPLLNNKVNIKPAPLSTKQEEQKKFLDQLVDPSKIENFVIPVHVNANLRPYQQHGVNWLAFLNQYNLHGILCDDMGLGKTLQSICILASDHYFKENAIEESNNKEELIISKNCITGVQSLIICPATLTGHWMFELQKFVSCQYLSPLDYSGLPNERKKLRERLPYHNVIIASYKIVRNEIDFFSQFSYNYVILDEGHIIKNPKTKSSIAIRKLLAHHRLILSGTPIQNSVLELWSLFDFLMPSLLGSEKQFQTNYARPVLQSRDHKSSAKDQENGVLAMEMLHRQTLPFILRRIKQDVLKDLPPKITQDYFCELSPLQEKLYEDFVKMQPCQNFFTKENSNKKTHDAFQALQYLRRVCNHPKLVVTEAHPKFKEIKRDMEVSKLAMNDINLSGKLPALRQLLTDSGIGVSTESVVSQHRALIFCQLKTMLDIIEYDLFKSHLPSVSYIRLDGNVPSNKRQELVHKFNTDPSIDVFLLTTHVGGLGLNLIGADTVIFVEHDWNPMRDLQAMDRAHRIGQKNSVNVYRLITKRTIEEKIMNLQKFKMMTANTVITHENSSLLSMGTGQILDLFTLERSKKENIEEACETNVQKLSIKEAIAVLPELWEENQYQEEYNIDSYLSSLHS